MRPTPICCQARILLALNTSSTRQSFLLRVSHIGPDFFETFDRDVLAGRSFTPSEIESGASVAVVDESFVRFVLGGRSAVGQQVREVPDSGAPGEWIEIVGVTSDISTSARKSIQDAQLYLPIGAIPPRPVTLVVHSQPGYRSDGLGQVAAALRETAADGSDFRRARLAAPATPYARRPRARWPRRGKTNRQRTCRPPPARLNGIIAISPRANLTQSAAPGNTVRPS